MIAMKARLTTTVIFLLILCLTFCGCDVGFHFMAIEIDDVSQQTYRIYVSGAVERDGYYDVISGTDYLNLIQLAGILSVTVLPFMYTEVIDGSVIEIILDYYDGNQVRSSINANSVLIALRGEVEGLTDDVVNKLADYVELNGSFTNKQQVELALGFDYADNYYKLFIAEADYEEID